MMKKLLFFALAGFGVNNLQAQEINTSERKNDIMLSPIELIAIPVLNVSYERLINENSGIGINGLFYLGGNNEDSDELAQISPYYRMYFGKKYASGFFVEGFVPITTTKEYYNSYPDYKYFEKRTTMGVGVGFGGKWIAKKNIVFEGSIGVGRRFGNAKNYFSTNIIGKWMLGIGYRF